MCVHVYVYTGHIYIHIRTYTYTHIHIYVCVCVCMCVFIHIYSFCSCQALGGTFTPLSPANITNNSDEKNYKLKTPNLQAALRLVCCV